MSDLRRGADRRPPAHLVPGFTHIRDERGSALHLSRLPRLRTAGETGAEVLRCFSGVVFEVLESAARRPLRMSSDSLLRWHRATFRSSFPEHAGRFRDDGASFGIRWREHGRLCTDGVSGAPVERMGEELDAAFAAYNGELEARAPERRTTREAVTAAATLYTELLRIHPFPDGNHRACFPALQGALVSLGATAVHFEGAVDAHDDALARAVQRDPARRTIEPFAELLLGCGRTSHLRLTRMEGRR